MPDLEPSNRLFAVMPYQESTPCEVEQTTIRRFHLPSSEFERTRGCTCQLLTFPPGERMTSAGTTAGAGYESLSGANRLLLDGVRIRYSPDAGIRDRPARPLEICRVFPFGYAPQTEEAETGL